MSIWKPVGGGGNAAGTVQRWRLRCLSRTPTAAAKNQSFRKAKTTVRFSTDYLEPGHWPSDTEAMEHVQRFQAAILDEINDRPQPRKTVAQDTHPTRVPRQHEREKLRLEDKDSMNILFLPLVYRVPIQNPENRTCGTAQSEIVLQVSYHSNRHYKPRNLYPHTILAKIVCGYRFLGL